MWAIDKASTMIKELSSHIEDLAPNSQRAYGYCWQLWSDYLDGRHWSDVELEDGERFAEALRGRGNKPPTVGARIHALKGCYGRLKDLGKVKFNPFATVRIKNRYEPIKPTPLFPVKLVKKLLRAPSESTKTGVRDRALLAILFGGGLRRHEAQEITLGAIRHLDEKTLYIHLPMTKARKPQQQPLPKWAALLVMKLVTQRSGEGAKLKDPLFVTYYRDGSIRCPMSYSCVGRIWAKWVEFIGNDGTTPHSARVTAITKLFEDNVEPTKIRDFARHASVSTTEGYNRRYAGLDKNSALKLNYDVDF